MSYMSTGVGPSPFLTTSRHHFHTDNYAFSRHPHYNTNSYTNSSSYLASFISPCSQEPKYFRSDMKNIFPQISRLQSEQEQKLLNPLNTYSGNVFSTSKISSPFDRGQIYYGSKNPRISSTSQSSVSTIIDQLQSSSYGTKKQNPFYKKYLLTQRNKQLENYAFYSTMSLNYQVSEPVAPKKKKGRNPRKFSLEKKDNLNEQDMTQEVLKMATKYDRVEEKRQVKSKTQTYHSSGNLKVYNRETFEPLPKQQQYNSQRQHQYLVESQVDQKQFDSFGQGKQYSKQHLRTQKVDVGDSLILGLAKMAENEVKQEKNREQQSKSRRQPVFIDSQDDERKSGTFKVPQAIIDQINNPRIPSTIFKKAKQHPSAFSIQRSLQISERGMQKQKTILKRQQQVQSNKIPPNMIMLRGKTYEKLTL